MLDLAMHYTIAWWCFFHPYFVLFNLQGDELKKSETSPSQRQTPIPFQVFKMFPVFMHTFIFDSILDTLKIVIPSFAVFSQWQIARASARVSIRFDWSIFRKKVPLTDKSGSVVDWLQFPFGQSEKGRESLYNKMNLRTVPCPLRGYLEMTVL